MQAVTTHLSEQSGTEVQLHSIRQVGGGCINACYAMDTSAGKFFVKKNSVAAFPDMFVSEAKGIRLINSVVPGIMPEVIAEFQVSGDQFLVLAYIEQAAPAGDFWRDFAFRLAQLHRHSSDGFGLAFDNYMGSLPQQNTKEENWIDFFINRRIEPQLRLAVNTGQLSQEASDHFAQLAKQLDRIFPVEAPALVHGDLWSGNFITGPDGLVRMVDPAPAFCHRETDIAMTRLFGGFDMAFYMHYNEFFPLEKGFEERLDIWQLYPLLVHVNLFGGAYPEQVKAILKRYA
jgi:fructosamine-3-kinase